ncbi:hypothetical protein GC098_11320 [Paenibacillus sp. LMG 31458]|uniref:Spore coat protein n=1 Tax=Paenibacillus phytorum TaxID=2654977 RepID=A0ABX1XVL8_9BACL|nr:hypothetical protein [Paenibacillus phytorum]NOU72001.1 hypothetical protein [Paenibacillus phytorum]
MAMIPGIGLPGSGFGFAPGLGLGGPSSGFGFAPGLGFGGPGLGLHSVKSNKKLSKKISKKR